MLLKSCAMPPASRPTASSRCAWRSCSSSALRPLASRPRARRLVAALAAAGGADVRVEAAGPFALTDQPSAHLGRNAPAPGRQDLQFVVGRHGLARELEPRLLG